VDPVAQDGGNAVSIITDVKDPLAVLATLAAPPGELGAARERHRVTPPLTIHIEK
jgi:hypothetical protein